MPSRWTAESGTLFLMLIALTNNLYKPSVTVATVLAVGVLVWRYRTEGTHLFSFSPACRLIIWSIVIFAGALVLSGVFSQTPVMSMRRGLEYFYWMIPFLLVSMLCKSEENLQAAWLGIIFAILFITFYGLYKQPEVLNFVSRMSSFYPHPNTVSAILILLLPFSILGIRLYHHVNKVLFSVAVLTSLVGLGGLIAAQSRGAYLGLLVGFLFWIFGQIAEKRPGAKTAIIGMVFIVGLSLMLSPMLMKRAGDTGNAQGDQERMLMWRAAIHMWEDHPVFGVGLGNFNRNYQNTYILPGAKEPDVATPHNTILNYLTESGTLGCSAYLVSLGLQLIFYIRYMKRHPDNFWLQAMFIAWIAIHVHGMVDVLLPIQPINRLYWVLFALSCASMVIEEWKIEKSR